MSADYIPSTSQWVADQVAEYEASGGTKANTLRDTGIPIIIVTMRGVKTGATRKIALMRVEHEGTYCLVASRGGAPTHPHWYANLLADSNVELQDGPIAHPYVVREISGDERAEWWQRSVAIFAPYAEYESKAGASGRTIPVLLAEPVAAN